MKIFSGLRVKTLREQAGLSQAEFARRLVKAGWEKLSQQYLARLEAGGLRDPGVSRVSMFAKVLDCDINDFFVDSGMVEES